MIVYSALTIAQYIIEYCNDTGRTISNLKLQKILYFVQAEFLVSKGVVCFHDRIEAWDFGPVVPSVYHHYRVYGSASIPYVSASVCGQIYDADKEKIEGIVEECADFSSTALVRITHRQDPWIKAYRPNANNEITPQSIKEFFQED